MSASALSPSLHINHPADFVPAGSPQWPWWIRKGDKDEDAAKKGCLNNGSAYLFWCKYFQFMFWKKKNKKLYIQEWQPKETDLQCASLQDSGLKRKSILRKDVITFAVDVRTFRSSDSNFKMNAWHLTKQMACALTFTHSLLRFLAFFTSEHKRIKKMQSKDEECGKVVENKKKTGGERVYAW